MGDIVVRQLTNACVQLCLSRPSAVVYSTLMSSLNNTTLMPWLLAMRGLPSHHQVDWAVFQQTRDQMRDVDYAIDDPHLLVC